MNWIIAFVVGVTLILQIDQSHGNWASFGFPLLDYIPGFTGLTGTGRESYSTRPQSKQPDFFGLGGSKAGAGAGAGAGNSPSLMPLGLGALGGLNSLGLQPRPNELFNQLSMGLLGGPDLLNGGGLLGSMLGRPNKARPSPEMEIGGASAGGGARIGEQQSMPAIGSASSGISSDVEVAKLLSGSNSAPSGVGGSDRVDSAMIAKLLRGRSSGSEGGGRSATASESAPSASGVGGSDKLDPTMIAKLLTARNGSGGARSVGGPEPSEGGDSSMEYPNNNY